MTEALIDELREKLLEHFAYSTDDEVQATNSVMEIVRPYLRTSEPVSLDGMKEIIKQSSLNAWAVTGPNLDYSRAIASRDYNKFHDDLLTRLAKAVLTAAGVKYE